MTKMCQTHSKLTMKYPRQKTINPELLFWPFHWIQCKGDRRQKSVYLTFDDGPHPEYSLKTMDILNKFNAPGHFFCSGKSIEKHPEILKDIRDANHIIGNHGYSHTSLTFMNRRRTEEEIMRTHHLIKDVIDSSPRYFRPPYGRINLHMQAILKKMNYKTIVWSLLTWDFAAQNPEEILTIVRKHLHPGAILVFHDGHRNAPVMLEALPDILKEMKEAGYHFSRLDQLGEFK